MNVQALLDFVTTLGQRLSSHKIDYVTYVLYEGEDPLKWIGAVTL